MKLKRLFSRSLGITIRVYQTGTNMPYLCQMLWLPGKTSPRSSVTLMEEMLKGSQQPVEKLSLRPNHVNNSLILYQKCTLLFFQKTNKPAPSLQLRSAVIMCFWMAQVKNVDPGHQFNGCFHTDTVGPKYINCEWNCWLVVRVQLIMQHINRYVVLISSK